MKYPPYYLTEKTRPRICEAVMSAPDGYVVQIQEETRTIEQNRLMWPLLQLWAKNRTALVNGQQIHVSREAWKVIHLADWRREEQEQPQMCLTPGGTIIPIGFETRTMPKGDFTRFLAWLIAETQNAGMDLPPRAIEGYEEYFRSAA